MKTLIAAAVAAAFALPAFAQTSTLPAAEERAKNRETVSSGAANAALTTKVKSALATDSGMGTLTSIDVDLRVRPEAVVLVHAKGQVPLPPELPLGVLQTALALREMGLEPGGVAMLGDDAEADVAGAQAVGLPGILVKTGQYRAGSEGTPDLLLPSVAELPEAL